MTFSYDCSVHNKELNAVMPITLVVCNVLTTTLFNIILLKEIALCTHTTLTAYTAIQFYQKRNDNNVYFSIIIIIELNKLK